MSLLWSEEQEDSGEYTYILSTTPVGVYKIEWDGYWRDDCEKIVYLNGVFLESFEFLCEAEEFAHNHLKDLNSKLRELL